MKEISRRTKKNSDLPGSIYLRGKVFAAPGTQLA